MPRQWRLSPRSPTADRRRRHELTEAEADEWSAIVHRLPQHWFPKETHGLLAAFLKHRSTHRVLCGLIEGIDVTVLKMDLGVSHYDKLLAMREREARAMASLATKLRLTNQARYTPATGTAAGARAV